MSKKYLIVKKDNDFKCSTPLDDATFEKLKQAAQSLETFNTFTFLGNSYIKAKEDFFTYDFTQFNVREVDMFNMFLNALEAMATTYPITIDELKNIPGVGEGKAKRYGEEFCALIKRHCEENEIDRPEDIRIRTVANKSKLKVAIINAIDRKVALDDLAISKGVEFDELLDDIESIVYSGTKLNIDYFLEEILDEENMLEIYDYFKTSDTDNINIAIEELGGEYSEEEIRLVRVKFISEMGN